MSRDRKRSNSPGYRIRIDNLPLNIDRYLLEETFREFGRVDYCRGFVEFASKDSAIEAVNRLHRAKFNGREVQITLKWPKQPLLSFKL
jgi:RNA recognition motif-containing protein